MKFQGWISQLSKVKSQNTVLYGETFVKWATAVYDADETGVVS